MRKTLTWVLLLVVAVAVPAMADEIDRFFGLDTAETFTEWAPGVVDRAAAVAGQQALADRLVASQVAAGLGRPLVVKASPGDLEAVARPTVGVAPLNVGVAAAADTTLDFAALARQGLVHRGTTRLPFGALSVQGQNGFVWSGAVLTPGAVAMRLHLTGVRLPSGVELYVYNDRGEARGPYTARDGEIWTHTLSGSRLALQLAYSGQDAAGALADTRFTLSTVAHLTEKFLLALGLPSGHERPELPTRAFCSFNEPCVVNAACENIPAAVAAAENAVAEMLFASGGFLYICTGGLVADSDSGSQIPYFLTANHCISKGREASSLETFFQFTTNCNGPCYNFQTAGLPGTVGASIVAANRTSDYTLLQLSQAAPAGSAFLGWNSTAVANSNGTNLYRISHPGGAPQAYSRHQVDTSKGTCSSWPRGAWIYSQDILGATEGGSSGSPVLNGNGQIVGQLSGACGFNVNDPCDSASNATVDGAFANYFSQVQPYLGGGGGGCTLGQPGDPCTSNGDCCSNKCKGPPGGKTCS